jgi:hypothetical protein
VGIVVSGCQPGLNEVGGARFPAGSRSIRCRNERRAVLIHGRRAWSGANDFGFAFRRTKFGRIGRLGVFKTHKDQPDGEITNDYVLEKLVLKGSVNAVVDQILRLREETGDFGELVYAGIDWVDPKLGKRSMGLMATEVMPRVNAAIGR